MRMKVVLGIAGFVALSTALAGVASAQQYQSPATPQQPPAQPVQTPSQPAVPVTPGQAPTTPAPGAPAPAQLPSGQYPNVGSLTSFSAQADYMSLAGYLRYLVYQQAGQWLTRAEAERVVRQEGGM
jgi:hypothetical protein